MATKPRSKREEDALKWRAVAAWVKYDQPHIPFDDTRVDLIEIDDGRVFVTISSDRRLYAAFRLRSDGQLKRMKRLPHELKQDES